jgi:type IV pilus assembly protein PilW
MIRRRQARSQTGFSLIEIMIGIVIGLIAVLVIYQIFAASEGIKRNTTSVGDAQQNGLFSSFMLGIEIANSGSALASAAQDLGTCPPGASSALTWRPIPVLINAGDTPETPDSFVVIYSTSNSVIAPAPFAGNASATAPYSVQSPNGFKKGDLVVAISGGGACGASRVTAVSTPDALGIVTVTHTNPGIVANFNDSAVLFNMGCSGHADCTPAPPAQKVRYDLSGDVLRSTALLTSDGLPVASLIPNPIASNVVNMKLQYGIAPAGGGPLQWISAATSPWQPVDLLSGLPANVLVAQLKTLRAVRIGMIFRGEQWDRDAPDRTIKMFDGAFTQTFLRSGSPAGNYRYRWYETVIPVRNEQWNGL